MKNKDSKTTYIERESYKHRYAKELLAGWFIAQEQKSADCKFGQFAWRRNFGVFKELRFHRNDHPYYFDFSAGVKSINEWSNPNDAFYPFADRGEILFVPDIVVFHQGLPQYIFEVVHTSPPTHEKLFTIYEFFYGYHIELYTVDAEWLLRQIQAPAKIKCNQLI